MIDGSHFGVMFQTGYGGHVEGPAQEFGATFTDGLVAVGLAGLMDFGEVAYIPNGFGGGGEVSAIGSQVREDSGYGFISHPRDGEEVFSGKGVFRFLGQEKLFDLFFELFDGGREVLDMSQEDAKGGGSGFFCSAGVDGGLRSFDESFDLLEMQVVSWDGADDFFDLFGLGLRQVFGCRKFLEDSCRGGGEGVFKRGLFELGEDDGEEGVDLALVVFTFLDEFVAEVGEFPEGLDEFFGDLALDIFTRSEELGDDQGVDIVGLSFLSQGFPEFVGVIGIEENDGETIFFEVGVEVFPETSGGFEADEEIFFGDGQGLEALQEVLEGLVVIVQGEGFYLFSCFVEQKIATRFFGHINAKVKHDLYSFLLV